MHLQKLITHLQKLERPQFNRFSDFVRSPYFRVPSSAVALFNYLALLYPQFEEKKILPPLIAKKVKELPTENKQAKAGTELMKGLERFLAVEQWSGNDRTVMVDGLWAQNYIQWQSLFEDNLKKLENRLEQDTERDIDYFYHRHLLTTIKNHGYFVKTIRNPQNNLKPVVKTLDEYYALKKLRYHCELLSRFHVLGIPYQKENVDELLHILEPYNGATYPYVYLFINVYQMLSASCYEDFLPYYQHIKNYIIANEKEGLSQALLESIEYANSACVNWFNKGNLEAGSESLWCVEIKIKHNQVIEQGIIQPIVLRNIITLAVLVNKEPEWISNFLSTYGPYLKGDNAATNLAFAQAQYYHYIKKYDKAMPLYQQAQVKDEPVFNVVVRRWQFMCLYEQNPDNKATLLDFLNAFDQYLKRNTSSLHHLKEMFAMFSNYCKKLLNLNTKLQRQETIKELKNKPYFTGKPWILQQLEAGKK